MTVRIRFHHLKTLQNLAKPCSDVVQKHSQPAIVCSKLTIETLEQGVKYVQS